MADNAAESSGRSLMALIVGILLPLVLAGMVWTGTVSLLQTTHPLEATVGRSMEPTLHTGELAVLQGVTPATVRVGDIVLVHVPKEDQVKYHYGAYMLHRVLALEVEGSTLMVQTKGDSQAPEPFTVPAADISGRLLWHIPALGYIFLFAHSKPGLIAGAGLVVLALLYGLLQWIGETMEEVADPEPGRDLGIPELAAAFQEYAVHLRSHTRVVQELGGTSEELRDAARTQNQVLGGLQDIVSALKDRLVAPAAWMPTEGSRGSVITVPAAQIQRVEALNADTPAPTAHAPMPTAHAPMPAALPSRRMRRLGRPSRTPVASPAASTTGGTLPRRRDRKRG